MTASDPQFICPACKSPVEVTGDGYRCASCKRTFPILFGIPDFRLTGDQYLSLEDEREKAGKLAVYAEDHDFKSLVSFYYSITDDVPERLAPIFADYVVNAPARSLQPLKVLAPDGGRALLDLGCGSGGGLAAAAEAFESRTGVDIALRWLVIAQKRLEELGVGAQLVCADAEALPFPDESYSHILAADLLENTRSPQAVVRASASALETGGRLYFSSSNRNWIGPHPATGVWAAGVLPDGFRKSALERRHGVDLLRAVTFVSPGAVRRMAEDSGLRQLEVRPLDVNSDRFQNRSILFRTFAGAYSTFARLPVFRTLLVLAGPVFQSLFVKEKQK